MCKFNSKQCEKINIQLSSSSDSQQQQPPLPMMPPPPLPPLPECMPIVEKTISKSQTEMAPAPYYQKVMHLIKPAFETRQFIKNRTKRLKKKAELKAEKEERKMKKTNLAKNVNVNPTTTTTTTAAGVAQSVATINSNKNFINHNNNNNNNNNNKSKGLALKSKGSPDSVETTKNPKTHRAFGRQSWEDETLDEWVYEYIISRIIFN